MLSTSHLLAFVLTAVVFAAVPGPSVLFTVSRAIVLGRRGALLTVVGNAAGFAVQLVAVGLGIGAVVARSAEVFTALKLVGAAYLVFLGVQAVRHRRALSGPFPPAAARTGRVLREGVVVGLTNPKVIVFVAAVLPQFVDPAAGHVPLQMLLLGLVMLVVALASDAVWALTAGSVRAWFARSPRRVELLGGTGGVTMIGLGAGLALTGRPD